MIFDYLRIVRREVDTNVTYEHRLADARMALGWMHTLKVVDTKRVTGLEAVKIAKQLVTDGWEGAMLAEPDEVYHIGKRVNHSIKLKYRNTADLRCIATETGEGKYEGLIGSLVLQDSRGRIVSVGSGLLDVHRTKPEHFFVGKIVEIEYEQLMATYIQPTFIRLREDKHESD
jgi:DNA ligase-1